MTTSLADVQDAIRQAIIDTGAVPSDKAVAWVDEQQPTAKVYVKLDIVYLQHLQDRDLNEEGDTPGEFEWSLSSLYYLRVQARVESIFNAPSRDALFTLEKVRAGLLSPNLEFGSEIRYQPDNSTYVHHISFPHEKRMISAYALEMGFRAVIDYPLDAPEEAAPNMVAVELDVGEADVGEVDPVEFAETIERP